VPVSDCLERQKARPPGALDDLYQGVLKPNPLCNHAPLFVEKARSYQSRWDWLNIQNMG
jgi:hypothetical protein